MILASHIRQFVFCPRIFYFYNFCDIRPKYPKQVDFGREYHEKQSKLFADRTFAKLKIKFEKAYENIYVETEELSGVLDLVLVCADEVVAVEFKNQKDLNLNKGTKMQLIAYAKLASKYFGKPFNRVALCVRNNLKFKIYNLKEADLKDFDEVVNKMKLLLKSQNFPDSSASKAACEQCEFLNYCDDRE